MISLFSYANDEEIQGGRYLSTAQAKDISSLSSVYHTSLLGEGDDKWATKDALFKLSVEAAEATKPILIYDKDAYASTFLLLLYFASAHEANRIEHDLPEVSAKDVFQVGAELGFDYMQDEKLVLLVEEVTGELVASSEIEPLPVSIHI